MVHRGFTLIELLVVISIIAVLASMLMPALKMVRTAAYSTKCVANVRQIGLGMYGYMDDYESCFPPQRVDWPDTAIYGHTSVSDGAVYWPSADIVGKYLELKENNAWVTSTNRVWRCPSDLRGVSWSQWAISYGINTNLASPTGPATAPNLWKNSIFSVAHLPQTMLVTDSDDQRWGAGTFAIGMQPGAGGFNWVKRHSGGASVLYCDFHAEHSQDLQRDVLAGSAYTR